MTNILSILGEVNGGRRGVHRNYGELGGFRAKGDFRLRSADFGLRILGGDMPDGRLPIEGRGFGLMVPAAGDPTEGWAGEKCVFAKRTQLENPVRLMPAWAKPDSGGFKNEPKRTQIGHLRTQIRRFWTGKRA